MLVPPGFNSSICNKSKTLRLSDGQIAKLLVTLTKKLAAGGTIPVTGEYLYELESLYSNLGCSYVFKYMYTYLCTGCPVNRR